MSAQEIKDKMSEKLKYVLSSKDNFDPYEGQKKMRMSKKIIIPSKFTAHDKIHRYGGKIEDPFNINTDNKHEMEKRVFTSDHHQRSEAKRIEGIKQIESTFKRVKQITCGMTKPGSNGKVTAKRVMNIMPMFNAVPQKIVHVINDDDATLTHNLTLENNLKTEQGFSQVSNTEPGKQEFEQIKKKIGMNNGQLLVNFVDTLENDKKFALYRYDASKPFDEEMARITLGKRKPSTSTT
jgi:hypothetical protein